MTKINALYSKNNYIVIVFCRMQQYGVVMLKKIIVLIVAIISIFAFILFIIYSLGYLLAISFLTGVALDPTVVATTSIACEVFSDMPSPFV
jgi:hypothetical protein